MNIDNVLKVLNCYYDEVNIINNDKKIIVCKKIYKNMPYQIFYFDYSGIWMNEEFDLKIHVEKILMNDYYSNAGYLQWNYYIVFLYDTNILDSLLLRLKAVIEIDETYSRKFVININELSNWLEKKYKVQVDGVNELPEDLGLLWTQTLQDNKLQCIYMKDVAFTKGIESILSGDSIKENSEKGNQTAIREPIQKMPHIKNIFLNSYRPYPKKKKFEFGKMNLLVGKNGCGKTSLLGSIELFLCGKNFRNPEDKYNTIDIKIGFEGEKEFRSLSQNTTNIFKLRDEFWYNNPISTDRNNLYKRFNKYNFYNTDASFELANEKGDQGNISKAFEDIALGESVNYIEKQLVGYKERLEREQRSCEKDLIEYSGIIKNENDKIEELKKENKSPELLLKKFIQEARDYGWNGIIPQEINDDYSTFIKDYNNIKGSISKLINCVFWINDATFNKVNEEYEKLNNLINDCEKTNKIILCLNEGLNRSNKDHEMAKKIEKLIIEIKPYFDTEIKANLIGLDKKVNELNSKAIKFQEVSGLVKKIDLQLFENSEIFIEEYYKNIENEIYKLEENRDKLAKAILELKSGLTQLESIISEIKANGTKYLEIVKDESRCPLCNAPYEDGELKKRIEEAFINIQSSNALEDMLREQSDVNINLQKLYTQKVNLNNTNVGLEKIYNNIDLKSKNLGFVASCLKQFESDYIVLKQQFENLSALKQEFSAKGLNENRYNSIINELEMLDINIRNIDETIDINKKIYNNSYIEIDKIKKLINEKSEHINYVIKNYLNDNSINPTLSILRERFENITSSMNLYKDIVKMVTVPESILFKEKESELLKLYELFKLFKEDKTKKDKIDSFVTNSMNTIKEYIIKVDHSKIVKNRIDSALNVINNIINNQGKDKYLRDFLQENRKKIMNIFNEIHSPQEFEDIYFDNKTSTYTINKSDNNITLKRIGSDELAKLSTISTGQRTALALSVFMCLNQKLKNGPSYLLFDDPISFVDDLNVLSFIDYLRENVISKDRQVFFVTANENLAFLIEQKFKMLGDEDFKVYTFDR